MFGNDFVDSPMAGCLTFLRNAVRGLLRDLTKSSLYLIGVAIDVLRRYLVGLRGELAGAASVCPSNLVLSYYEIMTPFNRPTDTDSIVAFRILFTSRF